jgi:hypothetical protein
MLKRLCIAAALGLGLAISFPTLSTAQPDPRVSAVSFADSPLTVTTGRASSTTAERAASVTWDATNVTSRPVREYSARVYVYRDGKPLGFRSTQQPIAVAPGKSQSAAVKLAGGLEVAPNDVVLIVITRVVFEDDTPWEGPDVLERVKAEVARIRGSAPAQ